MIKPKSILIKNIYYMLSYAFQNLNNVCSNCVATEEFDNIQDLFAVILYKGISSQIKQGLQREYEHKTECLSTLRGKINISSSIKQTTMINKKMVCEFDEFTENSYLNQILKSTCNLLLFKGELKSENKKLLKKLMYYFSNVETVDLKRVNWNAISYHRNNATYKMLINLCYLVVKGLLLTTKSGEQKLNKYLDDQYMHRLFEKFVLEFYRKHYPEFNPNASHIDWNVDDGIIEYLPTMKSDITLTYSDKTLIIDTKFYSHTMQTHFDKASIISGNLYQIFTYVKNKDKENTGNVRGMLLYAKTDENLTPDNDYIMSRNKISVKTLDLNQNWEDIKYNLSNIAHSLREF